MRIAIANIRLDGQTQARLALNTQTVNEYAEAMRDGHQFPPLVVYFDGSHHWLSDGFHRLHAMLQNEAEDVEVEVRTGTVEDAQLFAFGANAKRGLTPTPEDNRNIIMRMLAHPVSSRWSNAEIARHVGVSAMTVGRVRSAQSDGTTKVVYNRGDKQIEMNTKNIGRKPVKVREPEPEPEPEPDQPSEVEMQMQELAHTIQDLSDENQKLRDAIAVGQLDASEIEKMDVQDTIEDLRQQIKVLEADNRALRESRDMFQSRNAELMKTVKALQNKLKKLETV